MEIKTDFLILGSGIAGLSLAIKASTLGSVAIVNKKKNRIKYQLRSGRNCRRYRSNRQL